MRVMVMVKATKNSEAGVMPDEKLLAAMGKYNEELVKAGVMLGGEGAAPEHEGQAHRLLSGGKKSIVDGPFAETKELIAGYCCGRRRTWTRRLSGCVDARIRCPVRSRSSRSARSSKPKTFGAEFTPELRAQEERLRAQIEQQKS
ncbi:MAG: YciI family protein [Polyangiaceae bacterium]